MVDTPAFFVPVSAIDASDASVAEETLYTELAEWCGRPTPSPERRIYSILNVHNGEEWTVTVGERLRGIKRQTRGRGRQKTEYPEPLSDSAVVLAIFPGVPYAVVTNKRLKTGVRSAWENPFYVGSPKAVTYFSAPQGAGGTGASRPDQT